MKKLLLASLVSLLAVYHSIEENQYYYFGDSYKDFLIDDKRLASSRSFSHKVLYTNWLTDGKRWY